MSDSQSRFLSTDYLASGSAIQRKCIGILRKYEILEVLEDFTPVLAGTIPLGIDVEGSDLDILCIWQDLEEFSHVLTESFKSHQDFSLSVKPLSGEVSVVVRFSLENVPIEIVGQAIHPVEQLAFRHMIIEDRILQEQGKEFKEKIIFLKQKGIKTELAFAQLLGLSGDPYQAILAFE